MNQALVLFVSFLFISVTFAGDRGGNGGAGICSNGKCVTFAQAGFRLINDENAYIPPMNLLTELDKISQLMPKKLSLSTSEVISKYGDIVMVEIVDNVTVEKFLATYEGVLSNHGFSEKPAGLELLAFTVENKTYLIKNKFESLNLRGQALLLIHEFSLRVKKADLEEVLMFDGALVDYLRNVEMNGEEDYLSLLTHSQAIFLINPELQRAYTLNEILKQYGQPLLVNGFYNEFDYSLRTVDRKYVGKMNIGFDGLIRGSELIPDLYKVMSSGEIYTYVTARSDILGEFASYLSKLVQKSPKGFIVLNNDLMEQFLLSIKNRYSQSEIDAARYCGDLEDISVILNKGIEAQKLDFPVALMCHGISETALYLKSSIFSRLTGLSLNLEREFTCKNGPIQLECL